MFYLLSRGGKFSSQTEQKINLHMKSVNSNISLVDRSKWVTYYEQIMLNGNVSISFLFSPLLHIIIDVRRNSVADLTVLMEYVTVRRRNVNVVPVIRVPAVTNMRVIPLSTHVTVRQLYATLILRTLRTFKYLVFGFLTVEDCVLSNC